jgi:plastocyanin
MTKIKLISIFIVIFSLFFLGCVEEKPTGTPSPTATPIGTVTAMPTIVQTTPMPTPVPTQMREQKRYISYVDDSYGFFKVTASNGSAPYDINNRTLTINAGDTVRWSSASQNNEILIIVSKEGLWNNSSSILRTEFRYFDYEFDTAGVYSVYVDRFPKLSHQKIVVNP